MKKLTLLQLILFLLVSLSLRSQNWLVGGNNLKANGKLGTTSKKSVLFITKNSERGRVTTEGLWGFGTAAPDAKVHINSTAGQDPLRVDVDGSLKLYVNSNGGVSVGGSFIPPENGLFVSGNTGFGAMPGSYKMKISHGTFGVNIENATTLDDWELWSNSSGLSLYANGAFRGTFNITTGAYTSVSDERLKTNIQAMPSVLQKVNQLKPSVYQFKQNQLNTSNGSPNYGFIAQDVQKVFPHLVTHITNSDRGLDVYTLDYSGFGVIAIKAIQELEQTINTMENRIAQLEAKLNAISNNNGINSKDASTNVAKK